jgi:hypothetical protein
MGVSVHGCAGDALRIFSSFAGQVTITSGSVGLIALSDHCSIRDYLLPLSQVEKRGSEDRRKVGGTVTLAGSAARVKN